MVCSEWPLLRLLSLTSRPPVPDLRRWGLRVWVTPAFPCVLPGDNKSKWVKHWVKGGYYYYHNLETQRGGWDEPPGFVPSSTQLSREEIQVGHLPRGRRRERKLRAGAAWEEQGVARSPGLKGTQGALWGHAF